MAEVALEQGTVALAQQTATMNSPLYQRRGARESSIDIMPNPNFVFPALPSDTPSNAVDNWPPYARRPRSSQHLSVSSTTANGHIRQRGSTSTLPNFSFDPSADSSGSALLATPPLSPSEISPTTPSRPIGHRRGGSEFIGGDGRGGVGLMSSSPTKTDNSLPAAPARLGPPGGRGHRHRRSGAISCHDMQSILQPKDTSQPRCGSAPTTPLENEPKPFFGLGQDKRSLSSLRSGVELSIPQGPDTSPQSRPQPRMRVGFSDRVEYIRPLSTISSETESSMSTVRGHSVSGSMSSVVSNGAASPSSARMVRPSLHTTFEDEDAKTRPHTSGGVFGVQSPSKDSYHGDAGTARPRSAICTTTSVSDSESSASLKSPKWKGFPRWDHRKSTVTDSELSAAFSNSPPDSPIDTPSRVSMEVAESEDILHDTTKPRKPRNVKAWAQSVTLKLKGSHPKAKSPAFDPEETDDTGIPDDVNFDANFDIDNTVTIISEPVAKPMPRADVGSAVRRYAPGDSDARSPMIDLDAALGPFNTPPLVSNARDSAVRLPPRPRRSMHSLTFNSDSHRRTESAPELAPFDYRSAKAVPASTMPDVFEEEDEEESDIPSPLPRNSVSSSSENEDEHSIGIHVVDMDGTETPSEMNWSVGSTPDASRRPSEALPVPKTDSLVPGQRMLAQRSAYASSIEVVEDFEEPRASSLTRDSDSTITPPLTGDDSKAPRPVMNLSLPIQQRSVMTPDTLSGSSLSSPDFNHSQLSLSTPRLGTATSSGTGSRSFSFGEPGPAVRISVDDVPSLSSSRSTMTTPHNPFCPIGSIGRDERSGSVYSITSLPERRRKRSSIASLSRLVGGSFGERSKLSIESRPQSQHIDVAVTAKTKKVNRLSKLIHFWKKPSETDSN
ncbi:hypothetical protein EJ06DRAFT_137589 [Trichodelitschia bisporula]|uniref:Cell wall proline rich protein n=1 Tax=Trichodelitschia bisporula TaxID=703511 RepID=A0A6G1HNX5_9PEZI|nr:hypothetical protein EJ06DRAFT_137589 [Trichodelitschia bisporula]